MKSSWKKQRQATKKRQIKNIRIVKFYLGSECWLYYTELEKNCPECGYIMGCYENFDGCYYSCSRCDFQEEDWMKQELGYTQYKFNYITDYAKQIDKLAIYMEIVWQNRDSFKDDIDVELALQNTVENIERRIEEFKGYLKPFDKEDNQWNR